MKDDQRFLREAIKLAFDNVKGGGRPFGAVIVKAGEIIATGINEIMATNDPTVHAELMAIRMASQKLGSPALKGCTIYASGHPCPMCLAAMLLSGVDGVIYAYSNDDGAPFGLSTTSIYAELAKPFSEQPMRIRHVPVRLPERGDLYASWRQGQAGQP